MKSITESWPASRSGHVCTIDGWSDETYRSLTSKFHIGRPPAADDAVDGDDELDGPRRAARIVSPSTIGTPSSPDGPHV